MNLRLDGFRLRLLGLFFFPVTLIVLAVAIFATDIHRQAMRGLVATRDERTTESAAVALDEAVQTRLSLLDVAVSSLAENAGSVPAVAARPVLLKAFPVGFLFYSGQGEVLSGAGSLDVESQAIWKMVSRSQALVLTGSVAGQPVALFISRQADLLAVGSASLDELLQASAPALARPEGNVGTYLVGPGPALLASAGKAPPADLSGHVGVAAVLRGKSGSSFTPMADGEHVVSFAPVPSAGWGLVTEEPWQDVTSSVLDLSLLGPFALVPVLLLALLSLWYGARRVIEPLRRLEHAASELPGGNADAIEVSMGGITEIEQLRESLGRMSRRVREAQSALRAYIGAITNAQEEERQRVARELHDESIQHWIALDQRIQMVTKRLKEEANPESALVGKLHEEVQTGIQELRRISRGLRPIYLEDLGLVPALEMLAQDTQEALGIPVGIDPSGEQFRLSPEAELAVFRLVQEALTNCSRHARASSIQIRLQYRAGHLVVNVNDDGQGFEVPEHLERLAAAGHYGLMGMKERADAAGGELQITSSPGSGTSVRLALPLLAA